MKFNLFIPIFLILVITECGATLLGSQTLEYLAKPFLMLALLGYFLSNSRNTGGSRVYVAAALGFSWAGDILLLVEKTYNFLFLFGLTSFLFAHLAYVLFFRQIGKHNVGNEILRKLPTAVVFIYMSLLYAVLFPTLGAFKIPVLLYSLVISLMIISCIHAFDFEKHAFGFICIAGTVLFVISDSVLAINRFVVPFQLGPTIVMLTYAVGQLLITEGAIRNLRKLGLN